MHVAVPLATGLISLAFALTVFDQYLERRRPYQLVWTIGLLLYAIASLFHTLWSMGVYGEAIFRLWYLAGAMLVAAYLGMGSLYLHAARKVAHAGMALLLLLTIISIYVAFATSLQADSALLQGQTLSSIVPGTDSMRFYPTYVSILTAVLNSVGASLLFGTALYSAVRFALRKAPGYRVLSTALIAAGAFVSAAGGALERFNMPEPHTVALLIGVVLIYLGFLRSREVFVVYRIPFLHRVNTASR